MIRFAVLSLFVFASVCAQPGFVWQRTVGGSALDALQGTVVDTNGNIWAGGISASNISFEKLENSHGGYDFWVLRFDDDGNLIWQKTIGGSEDDSLTCLVKAEDGSILLGGQSTSGISGDKTENCRGYIDYWVVKLNPSGAIVWQKTIGGNSADFMRSLVPTVDGGILLGGYSSSGISGEKTEAYRGNGSLDYWVVKLDASGAIAWQRTLGGDLADELDSVIQTADGGFIVAGKSGSNASSDKTENSRGGNDLWVIKLDSSGAVLWQRTIGGSGNEEMGKVLETWDGKIILAGSSISGISGEKTENSRGSWDFWIVQLDANGANGWQRTIGGSDGEFAYDMIETPNHHLLVGGDSRSNTSGEKTEDSRGLSDCWIIELSETGELLGQKTFGGDMADGIKSLSQNTSGEIVAGCYSRSGVSGEKQDFNRGDTDFWIVKLTSESLAINASEAFSDFALYPNPALNAVHLSNSKEPMIEVTVRDVLGKQVLKQGGLHSKSLELDISSLKQGAYFIEIKSQSGYKTIKKLIVL